MQSSKLHLLSLSLPAKQKKLTSRFDNKWLAHFSSDFEFPTNITYFTIGTETGTSTRTSRCSQFLALKPTTQNDIRTTRAVFIHAACDCSRRKSVVHVAQHRVSPFTRSDRAKAKRTTEYNIACCIYMRSTQRDNPTRQRTMCNILYIISMANGRSVE